MKIALVGNQNSGKTTLFNLLTGTNQKVGNWPGVTIERKEGKIKETEYTIVDLPGIYSMSPYTLEEEVSRKYVFTEKPDIIINIVDATSIERSLYLTTQLLELDSKVIIALNMCDQLEKKKIKLDEKKLSELLHTTVVKISALKGTGIDELIQKIKTSDILENVHTRIFSDDIEKVLDTIDVDTHHQRFVKVKTLEKDKNYKINDHLNEQIKILENRYQYDIEQIIANQRYDYIVQIKKQSFIQEQIKETITDKLDKVFLHKWLSLPIFFIIMVCIYFLAVGVLGSWTVDVVDGGINEFKQLVIQGLENLNVSNWLISLIGNGIIAGVGAVLNFVPQLIILFFCISILETSGYMSRIAFVFDRLFRKFGLNGKSLIPFIVGSGCSVPAIMTARTIEDQNERKITIMTTSFIPCSAKLPIIALFAGYFFPNHSALITASLYFLAIFVIIISAFIMKKIFIKTENSAFISELPEYKLPSVKYVGRDVFDKTIAFIKRAGTVILLSSVIIWFMLSFSFAFWKGMVDIEDSILASIGKAISWLFYPFLGEFSWAASVSAIQGLVAKEQVVSSMEIIAGLSDGSGSMVFDTNIFSFFTKASAYAYAVFCLFSAPCIGAIGAMRKELGSAKAMWQAVLFQTGIAWLLATIIYWLISLLMVIF